LTEKENLTSTGKGSTGLSSLVDYIKNVDQEQAKRERLHKLDAKISEVFFLTMKSVTIASFINFILFS
jgi:hypothetical protein